MTQAVRPLALGQTELREIPPGTPDYRRWIDIAADAYPIVGLTTVAARETAFVEQRDLATREPEHRLVGAFRGGVLVGGMRLYDFWMTVRGAPVFSGGLGSVAVALEARGRGVARDLVGGYLRMYRERGAALGVLYPFRPDFYKQFGFGYGAKLNQYRVALAALPTFAVSGAVRRLDPDDTDQFLALYNELQARTHGLIRRERWRAAARLGNAVMQTYGHVDDRGRLTGYITFEVRPSDVSLVNCHELYLIELIYADACTLRALLAFVRSLRDQFATLIVNTTDPDFHFLLDDPRNGSNRNLYPPVAHETNAQGVGVMYRVLALPAFIAAVPAVRFGDLTAVVRIDMADAFCPANAGAFVIAFAAGAARLVDAGTPADVELRVDVGELSSVVMGAVRLRSLVAYGLATLSDVTWLERLDAAFDSAPPQCLTRF